MSEDLQQRAAPTPPTGWVFRRMNAGWIEVRGPNGSCVALAPDEDQPRIIPGEILYELADAILRVAPAATAGQQGEARPAPTAPNLACPSVQARLAEQWGYVRAPEAQAEPAGEPVAWGVFIFAGKRAGKLYSWGDTKSDAEAYARNTEQSRDDITLQVRPIYDHPAASGERDTLRALLREAAPLLRVAAECTEPFNLTACWSVLARIDAALADGGAK